MAGASSSRLLRTTKASKTDSQPPSSSTSGKTGPYRIPSLTFPFLWEAKKAHRMSCAAEQKAATATSITQEKQQGLLLSEEVKNVDLLLPLTYEITRRLILRQLGATWLVLNRQRWSKIAETIIHRAVISCQSFSLIGVAGSLVGSIPCFTEGCVIVVKSFFLQFRAMSQTLDQAEIMKLLIQALDMFLIGTALLTFGMGMYVTFNRSQSIQDPGRHTDTSHLGKFNLKKLKEGAKIRCITTAKTRIGHAILLLLQAAVLEEFKSVPLVSGFDLACFAGTVLASSAGVFLLSKITMGQQRPKQNFA
ncbi:hypothetical protein ACP4OV_026602 [Aristida adscensionis]